MGSKKDRGWIKLHRQVTNSKIWTSTEEFDRRSAWIDILLSVNHEARTIILRNGQSITIEEGQMFTSLDHLASRWHWSRNRVRRYLGLLSAQCMCTVSGTPSGTVLTVINWDFFQHGRHTNGQANGQANGQTDGQTDGQRTRNNTKNYYNKNEKKNALEGAVIFSADGEVSE